MRSPLSPRRLRFSLLPVGFWSLFFAALFARMIFWRDGGIWVGHENVWSDWALHIGLATRFATEAPSEWFAYHPMFADGKMTYTFLTNLISGLLMRAGLSLPLSFILPSIVFSIALVTGLYRFLTLLLRSRRRATIALFVFFMASGLGFIDLFREWFNHPTLAALLTPLKQYSRIDPKGWYAGNFLVGHFIPQRSFLLGMPLAIWASVGLLSVARFPERRSAAGNRRVLLLSALAAGILPITHAHSLIALPFLMGPVLFSRLKRWREFLWFAIPALALSVTLYCIFIRGGISNPDFMSWHPGYNTDGVLDWLGFWGKAWGLMLPLAIAATALSFRRGGRALLPRDALAYSLGGWALFAICNLVLLQPVSWDNSKIFVWCYLTFSAVAACAIDWLWRGKTRRLPPIALRSAAAAIAILLTLTGFFELELFQQIGVHSHQILGAEEVTIADQVRAGTGPDDRFLTSTDHNHWVMVRAARPILMGFMPWVWNFGFDYKEVEADIPKMYHGGPEGAALLAKHRIRYVVIGPAEEHNFHPDVAYFDRTYPVKFQSQRYKVYEIKASP